MQSYCTGPAAAFVGLGSNGAPVFLGYSESGFTVDTRRHYEPLMSDIGGSRVPFDTQNQGQEAFISGVLTVWNEAVFAALESRDDGGVRGVTAFGGHGAFMGLENLSHCLWLAFPYATLKPAMQGGARSTGTITGGISGPMEKGRRYPFATLETNRMDPVGSRALKRHVGWHCLRAFDVKTLAMLLWDGNMTSLPAVA